MKFVRKCPREFPTKFPGKVPRNLGCPKHSQNKCFGCVQAECFWICLETAHCIFLYTNLQIVLPPYDMACLMRISLYFMKNDGVPMIPGVEPILLDLENPFLPSRDLKNRRKTKKLEITKILNFLFFLYFFVIFSCVFLF